MSLLMTSGQPELQDMVEEIKVWFETHKRKSAGFIISCRVLGFIESLRGDPPVGQGHAVKQAGQSGVDAQAPGAARAVPVRLAPGPVHRVKVIF